MGIHAPAELRAADPFPRFELIDLGFDLSHGEDSLDALTSAQLAVRPPGTRSTRLDVPAGGRVLISCRDVIAGRPVPSGCDKGSHACR